jgi:hypothetical protein
VLIVIALLTSGTACSQAVRRDTLDADQDSDAGQDAGEDADQPADADVDAGDADADTSQCLAFNIEMHGIVDSPPEGVTPDPLSICAWETEPVESNRAATVTLNISFGDLSVATGRIDVPPAVLSEVVGLPTIDITSNLPEVYLPATVTEIQPAEGGFTFHIRFPEESRNCYPWRPGEPAITILVSFYIRCDPSGTVVRTVESSTNLWLCNPQGRIDWFSSGNECVVCEEVCEMAPSPIVPDGSAAGTGLPRAIDAGIALVAQVGRAVCLVAEHQGTKGPVSYRWDVSSGTLDDPDSGGVVWELPKDPGPHLAQVVVTDRDSTAVATLRYRHHV